MTIKLHQKAPWNRHLRNTYRERYTQVGDRYFQVQADNLSSPWFVHEINADGSWVKLIALCWNLPAARQIIQDSADGYTDDEVQARADTAKSAGTGRNAPRNVERRRAARGR